MGRGRGSWGSLVLPALDDRLEYVYNTTQVIDALMQLILWGIYILNNWLPWKQQCGGQFKKKRWSLKKGHDLRIICVDTK